MKFAEDHRHDTVDADDMRAAIATIPASANIASGDVGTST